MNSRSIIASPTAWYRHRWLRDPEPICEGIVHITLDATINCIDPLTQSGYFNGMQHCFRPDETNGVTSCVSEIGVTTQAVVWKSCQAHSDTRKFTMSRRRQIA